MRCIVLAVLLPFFWFDIRITVRYTKNYCVVVRRRQCVVQPSVSHAYCGKLFFIQPKQNYHQQVIWDRLCTSMCNFYRATGVFDVSVYGVGRRQATLFSLWKIPTTFISSVCKRTAAKPNKYCSIKANQMNEVHEKLTQLQILNM